MTPLGSALSIRLAPLRNFSVGKYATPGGSGGSAAHGNLSRYPAARLLGQACRDGGPGVADTAGEPRPHGTHYRSGLSGSPGHRTGISERTTSMVTTCKG